jgi:hypothetical protein
MHFGSPFVGEMIALMCSYPQVQKRDILHDAAARFLRLH